jgi:ATP-dependent Clp protease ATP-binding subunit ClpA
MSKTKYKVSDEELEEMISKYCRDITALARLDRFDPITGRDKEIQNAIIILLQKGRKNVALLAPAGVGKTALVVGLAQQIVANNVPKYLKDARVIEIDLPAMAAGTSGPAEFQGRFIPMCKGFAERYHDRENPRFILFIDEFHTIMPQMMGSAYRGLSEVMKPYLTVGDLHVIGATTEDEFRIYVAVDPAMDRRFQQVFLTVPNAQETFSIMQALRGGYEKHHGLTISDECLQKVIDLTNRFLPRRNQPDKSIVMMDGACALQVMEKGDGGELTLEYVRKMISTECKLSPEALD